MKIYTRTGDQGKTALFSGERVTKDQLRVAAYGTVDELNSLLGLAHALCADRRVGTILQELQHQLFRAGADLATSFEGRIQPRRIEAADWKSQETLIDQLSESLPPLRAFILPTGTAGASMLQVARAVCRRAERELVGLKREEKINDDLLVFFNRLSDLLFVLARFENFTQGGNEVLWKTGRQR